MSMLTLTLTRILIVMSLTVTLRGGTPDRTPAGAAGTPKARTSAPRFVADVEGCREQPVAQPVAPAACE